VVLPSQIRLSDGPLGPRCSSLLPAAPGIRCPFRGEAGAISFSWRNRSVSGTDLDAVRGAKGPFTDIQTYQRAHGQDVKRRSKNEGK
jgi:hypothetical protein